MRWLLRWRRGTKRDAGPKWLQGYDGQTTAELIELEGSHRLDSLVLAFEQALEQKVASDGLAIRSEPERVILAVEAIEREVNNGGYDQLFRNPSKDLTPYFVSSLQAIGCPVVARVTDRAIKALKLPGPVTAESIDAVMAKDDERRDARLEKCDEEYFEGAGDLAGPLFAYIKANADRISLT